MATVISIHYMSWFKEDDLGISKIHFPFNWFFKEVFSNDYFKTISCERTF